MKQLNLSTLNLTYRRISGDMIEVPVYKICSRKYDDIVTSWLTGRHVESSYDLRNHRFSIYQSAIQFDTRKFSFTNRLISAWNSLSDSVVSANTVNTFKNRLDRFWKNQEVQES